MFASSLAGRHAATQTSMSLQSCSWYNVVCMVSIHPYTISHSLSRTMG
jgi:hypothetical protein